MDQQRFTHYSVLSKGFFLVAGLALLTFVLSCNGWPDGLPKEDPDTWEMLGLPYHVTIIDLDHEHEAETGSSNCNAYASAISEEGVVVGKDWNYGWVRRFGNLEFIKDTDGKVIKGTPEAVGYFDAVGNAQSGKSFLYDLHHKTISWLPISDRRAILYGTNAWSDNCGMIQTDPDANLPNYYTAAWGFYTFLEEYLSPIDGFFHAYHRDINNHFEMVGVQQHHASGARAAYIYRPYASVEWERLPTGGGQSIPYAINDLGEVVGWRNSGGFYSPVAFTEVETLGPMSGSEDWNYTPRDINNYSVIVGNATKGNLKRAVVYVDGVARNLNGIANAKDFVFETAYAINDWGTIVGGGYHKTHGDYHAYILSPKNWPPFIHFHFEEDDPYTLNLDRVGGGYTVVKGIYPGFKGIDPDLLGDGERKGNPEFDDSGSGGHGDGGDAGRGGSSAHFSLSFVEVIGEGTANADSSATFTVPPLRAGQHRNSLDSSV